MATPVNAALCSFGMSGVLFHAPFLHVNPGFNLYAVWERTKNLSQQKYPNVKIFRSLEEMLADEQVELVVVNTPSYTHYEFTKKALLAGKHVLVEKPFTSTVAEGKELIELAAKQKKLLTVYQNRRYDSDYKTVKKILSEDWLGKIVEAEIHYDRYRVELSHKQHKEEPVPGAGVLYDLGSHLIDQALQLFGMPQALFADITSVRPHSKVDDYFELIFYYPGCRVRVKSNIIVRHPIPGYVLHGMKGSFIKPKTDVQEAMLLAGKEPGGMDWGIEPESERGLLHTEKDGKIILEQVPSQRGNYGEFYDGVYKSIRENAAPPVDPNDSLQVISIIQAAFKSSAEKRVIEF